MQSDMSAFEADDPVLRGLDVYLVGGAVRDALMQQPCGDRDWVVVGTTPQDMVARGFMPVGGDFPVFLHPHSKEEYALARTERKSGRGYKGFTFYAGLDVTLEQDLRRRDLTLNAIARTRDGRLVDPLNGQADIRAKVLRHVGEAFEEDPVRLLRLARFAARFHDFSIAPQTLALARAMVNAGEVDALVPERVWQELSKGLMTAHPVRMLQVLTDTTALPRILPGLDFSPTLARHLDCAVRQQLSLPQRFALLCLGTPTPFALAQRLKTPRTCLEHAKLLPLVLKQLASLSKPPSPCTQAIALETASAMLDVMEQTDALRRPDRFTSLLQAAACVIPTDLSLWQRCLQRANSIDAGAIAKQTNGQTATIQAALRKARLVALPE